MRLLYLLKMVHNLIKVQKNYKETPIEDFNKDNDLSTEEGRANFAKLKKDKGVADKFSD